MWRRQLVEIVIVGALLTVLGAAVYGPNAIHGGFISDAWSNRAIYKFAPGGGFSGGLSNLLNEPNIAPRPLYAVYLALLNMVFGPHMGFWLGWLLVTNIVMSLALYMLLRKLSLRPLDAALISGLVLLFPADGSLKFWAAMVQAPPSIAFALLGFLSALSAFDARGTRRTILHGMSLMLFVASLLLYEVMLPLMLASALLYRLHVRWRPAVSRWALDCAALLPIALLVTGSSSSGHWQAAAGIWNHAVMMLEQVPVLVATVVLPLGSAHWYTVLLIALLPVVSLLVYCQLPSTHEARPELRRWLTVMASGGAVVTLSYAIFVPGIDYYIPMGAGIANRVNAVPSIGWVLALYAGIMLAATLAWRGLSRAPLLSGGLAALACGLIAAGWLSSLNRESHAYTRAFAEDERVLQTIRVVLPKPIPHSTIWTFGQPVEMVPGVPVFGNTWDMTSSVQLAFNDPNLSSYVAFPGTTYSCRRVAIVPKGAYPVEGGPGGDPFASLYGRTYFIDTNNGRSELIRTPGECRRAAREFPPSPPLPPE